MQFNVLFETDSNGNYVGVLQNSALVNGSIVTQDSGSSDGLPLYYQVAGEGVNGKFATALGDKLRVLINTELQVAYDSRFGAKAWAQDSKGRRDRLTSFYIPLPSNAHRDGHNVGKNVAGIIYSVGPRVSGPTVTDRDEYRKIYLDAFAAVADANPNATIHGMRISMLSTGIYGPADDADKAPMRRDAAGIILEALEASADLPNAAQLPLTVLVNCGAGGSEIDAFSHAAAARGITVTSTGFTFDLAAQTNVKRPGA